LGVWGGPGDTDLVLVRVLRLRAGSPRGVTFGTTQGSGANQFNQPFGIFVR